MDPGPGAEVICRRAASGYDVVSFKTRESALSEEPAEKSPKKAFKLNKSHIQGFIAERAMYWDNGTGQAFHASIGLDSPHMAFMLPDGQTSAGFETWTLVENPNPSSVTIRITYLPQGGGKSVSFTDEILKDSRRSYNMADKLPEGRASILVQSLDGARPVMVERSMYMNSRGAGTDTIGGYSD